jgi:hypothetical protein
VSVWLGESGDALTLISDRPAKGHRVAENGGGKWLLLEIIGLKGLVSIFEYNVSVEEDVVSSREGGGGCEVL